jgi:hypothetical protein
VVDATNTVLDAQNTGRVLLLAAPYLVADFEVDGLTFQNGNISGGMGGGLRIDTNGNVLVKNSNIVSS